MSWLEPISVTAQVSYTNTHTVPSGAPCIKWWRQTFFIGNAFINLTQTGRLIKVKSFTVSVRWNFIIIAAQQVKYHPQRKRRHPQKCKHRQGTDRSVTKTSNIFYIFVHKAVLLLNEWRFALSSMFPVCLEKHRICVYEFRINSS